MSLSDRKEMELILQRARELIHSGAFGAALDRLISNEAAIAGNLPGSLILGYAARMVNAHEVARRAYSGALDLDGENAEARIGLAWAMVADNDLSAARSILAPLATTPPEDLRGQIALAEALSTAGAWEDALNLLDGAIARWPGDSELRLLQADVQFAAGRETEALQACIDGLRRTSDPIGAALVRYKQKHASNEPHVARFVLEAALTLAPRHVPLLIKAATYDLNKGRIDQGIALATRALSLAPNNAEALSTHAVASGMDGDYTTARAELEKALLLSPANANVIWRNLGSLHAAFGNGGAATDAYHRALTAGAAGDPALYSAFLLSLRYWPSESESGIADIHREWGAMVEHALARHTAPRESLVPAQPRTRIRVGYLSADFRQHSVMYFFEPVLAHHDRQQFEIYCYDDGSRHDAMTLRIRDRVDHWRDLRGLDLATALRRIRGDQLDILVDLSGHMMGNRLSAFAARAAAVQGTWLGCPGTTGLRQMDFKFVDALTDPPGPSDQWYTEKLLRLPVPFCVYRPPEFEVTPAPPPVARAGFIRFGSFNNPQKLSDLTLDTWGKVIQSVPGSRLRLKGPGFERPKMQATWRQRLSHFGIPHDRVEFIGKTETTLDHLRTYDEIDIALDTLPYNGATTTCEALWMGVPVVTCWGEGHAARVGGSLLTSLGLTSLIGRTPEDFVRVAVDLAHDLTRLAALRAGLRDTFRASPLMNYPAFMRELESAYRSLLVRAEE